MRKDHPPHPPLPLATAAGGSSSSSSKAAMVGLNPCSMKAGLKRGPWTHEEDMLLKNFINKEGEGRWRTLPKKAGLRRCGKSCRLRWMNYLRPSVKRGPIAQDEEDLNLRLHRLLGNRWSLIAGRIPGRTDNEIKNYWNTHLSKKLIRQGIDPTTHKPLNSIQISSNSRDKPLHLSPNYNFNQHQPIVYHDASQNDNHTLINITSSSFITLPPHDSHHQFHESGGAGDYYSYGDDDVMGSTSLRFGNSCDGGDDEDEDPMMINEDDGGLTTFLNSLINEDDVDDALITRPPSLNNNLNIETYFLLNIPPEDRSSMDDNDAVTFMDSSSSATYFNLIN